MIQVIIPNVFSINLIRKCRNVIIPIIGDYYHIINLKTANYKPIFSHLNNQNEYFFCTL